MDYKHCRCKCGGIIGQYNKVRGFTCEKCDKEYQLSELKFDRLILNEKTGWIFPMLKKGRRTMKNYTIKLPRGLEVDIFNLPENFDEEINRVFGEYTQQTSEDYRDCDRLGFIDCCVRYINGDKDRYDVVDEKVEDYITSQWREYGQLDNKDDVYGIEFMADCYAEGIRNAALCSHFGADDHHIYDQIQKVLVRIIRVVMSYEDKEDTKC